MAAQAVVASPIALPLDERPTKVLSRSPPAQSAVKDATVSVVRESSSAEPMHAFYAFEVLRARLEGDKTPDFPRKTEESFPLFVTWNICSRSSSATSKSWKLRGCIGNFSPMPLAKGLAEYAIISALRDHRFSPITLSELPRLQCTVSLLVQFEACKDPYDWEIGTHGIRIHFSPSSSSSSSRNSSRKHSRALSACFLPEVADHAGWDKRETLEAAIRKAGYTGRIDDAFIREIEVQRYQSSAVTVTYDEWRLSRDKE